MSATLQHYSHPYPPFHPESDATAGGRLLHRQTPGLDTLAKGSQYALERLQLSQQANINGNISKFKDQPSPSGLITFNGPWRRESLSDPRAGIRKNSSSAAVRRRISRACDQCNQLRTKCDGQSPCAHCIGKATLPGHLFLYRVSIPKKLMGFPCERVWFNL
jgi:xylanolytic transcriptional activator XlnR